MPDSRDQVGQGFTGTGTGLHCQVALLFERSRDGRGHAHLAFAPAAAQRANGLAQQLFRVEV